MKPWVKPWNELFVHVKCCALVSFVHLFTDTWKDLFYSQLSVLTMLPIRTSSPRHQLFQLWTQPFQMTSSLYCLHHKKPFAYLHFFCHFIQAPCPRLLHIIKITCKTNRFQMKEQMGSFTQSCAPLSLFDLLIAQFGHWNLGKALVKWYSLMEICHYFIISIS